MVEVQWLKGRRKVADITMYVPYNDHPPAIVEVFPFQSRMDPGRQAISWEHRPGIHRHAKSWLGYIENCNHC